MMIKEIIYSRLELSRGLLRRMRKGGGVTLNGQFAHITQRVTTGDIIHIRFADEPTNLQPQRLDLDILYEDDFLLVINKVAGMAVYPTPAHPQNTLANGLAYLWQERGLQRKVRLVHRLDRETTGAIIVAKEPYAYQGLVTQLRNNTLERQYLAIVQGNLSEKTGVIDQPISHQHSTKDHGMKRIIADEGKAAKTYYRVIQEYPNYSLLSLKLASGRTHQIRVHLQWLGFPIVGDHLYNQASKLIDRQALHAWSVRFNHPRTDKELIIRAPIPDDMKTLLEEVKNKS